MKNIVALVDFSDVAPNVLKQVQVLAEAFKSHVTVLHGIPVKYAAVDFTLAPADMPQEPTAEELHTDLARLEKMTEPLRASGVDVSLKQLRDATIANTVEEAFRIGPDLIVVGSHHHNAFYNLFIGNVTNDVLKRAKCPVLVVPA